MRSLRFLTVVALLTLGALVPSGAPEEAMMLRELPGDALFSARKEVNQALGLLRHSTESSLRAMRFENLLRAYLQLAKVHQQGGDAEGAYQALLEGEAWETMALSVGINEPVVAPELARYRAKLVYRDGRGLLVLLGSKALSDGDKRCLMDLLERAVERESALPLWSPAQELYPSELPADVKARLEGIREKRGKLEEPAKKQEEAALKLLDTYIDEMGILVEAGLPVQAEQVIREGSRRGQEEEKFQSLRGERCPLDLPAGLFWDYYLLSSHYYPSSPGDLLPSYLHSRDLPEKRKQALLSYMRECFHLNGSGGAGLNP